MSNDNPPLYSMTGFGRSHSDWESHRVTVELTSVNSKFLDVSFHAPPGLGHLEAMTRKRLGKVLQRGKVRCVIRFATGGSGEGQLSLNEQVLREYLRLYNEIKSRYGLEGTLTAEGLLFSPDVLSVAEISTDDGYFTEWLDKLIGRAIDELLRMRSEEGEELRRDLQDRTRAMDELTARIREMAPGVKVSLRQKLSDRLAELDEKIDLTKDRLATEVVLLAERADITEELVRLASHLKQFLSALTAGGPIGRKLDFLSQEINREVNTIGSKASDLEIGSLVVTFKEELARTREQLQNVE